ncbi:helix-hairpin-helix domain-containing protein [bacterium]|nr:helix-hairpin-helix domain-containing protein [bacterium]
MKRKTTKELKVLLSRLELKYGKISDKLYMNVKDDYITRLAEEIHPFNKFITFNPALKRLFENLSELMEEILIRVYTGEFTKEDLFNGIIQLNLFSSVNELIVLFTGLEKFKESIQDLTNADTIVFPVESIPKSAPPDIADVISDFDNIDIFADYDEGDETYDTRYEEEDRWVLNELFLLIMDGYIEPIAVGIRSVLQGNRSSELINALLASLRPLHRSAETMGFVQMSAALYNLESILTKSTQSGGINPNMRISITKAYSALKSNLPQSGNNLGLVEILDSQVTESSLMLTLLNSGKIEEWVIQTLVEVGINTPEKLAKASAAEISDVTGLSHDKSKEILLQCRYTAGNK